MFPERSPNNLISQCNKTLNANILFRRYNPKILDSSCIGDSHVVWLFLPSEFVGSKNPMKT